MKARLYKTGEEFLISRSRMDRFLECKRCSYFELRCGIRRPSGPPFLLNSFVDRQLKREMDHLRNVGEPLPYRIDGMPTLKPWKDAKINEWRNAFRGIRHHDRASNLILYGALDEVLTDESGKLYVADFKATSSAKAINLNDKYKQVFQRQVSFYSWLLEKNDYPVSERGILLFFNTQDLDSRFQNSISFAVQGFSFPTDGSWIQETAQEMKTILDAEKAPSPGDDCEFCRFTREVYGLRSLEGWI